MSYTLRDVTTTVIILSSNKMHDGDILVPAYPGPPGKNGRQNEERIGERERERERSLIVVVAR